MKRYHLYLDDSGTKDYCAAGQSYAKNGNTRHFCFGGLLLPNDAASKLAENIAERKIVFFGEADVEIKSNWLRRPDECQRRYIDPFGISENDLKEFISEFYGLIQAAELQLLAAVVDKVHMTTKYPSPWYAPAVAYEFLLQRAVQEVTPENQLAVTIDDMSGATPKGNQYKKNLKAQHAKLQKEGSRYVDDIDFSCLQDGPRFLNSKSSHLLQVADVVAYNVYRQFSDYGEAWEDEVQKELPEYEWFSRLTGKFRCDGDGRVQGFGIVKIPLHRRVRWIVDRK